MRLGLAPPRQGALCCLFGDPAGVPGYAVPCCLEELHAAPACSPHPGVESGPDAIASLRHAHRTRTRLHSEDHVPASASQTSVPLEKCHPGRQEEPPAIHRCASSQEAAAGSLVG
ncbi:uncharacterized protein isoform X5 [Castor canadensis]|uniref:Uncharacterized protein isoform X5 n=1 Tax=Castor canadensis TaxID=51338 RepID=A0AC58KTM1_CASCN